MEALTPQDHCIAVSPNRKQWLWVTCVAGLFSLFIVGMDVFVLWAFWNQYDIDTGAYVAATMLFLGTAFLGWVMFIVLYRLRRRDPAILITAQGLFVDFPLRFTFPPSIRGNFIPWEEIEWIASFRPGKDIWFSLSLKDPAHYWALYGHGPYHPWHRNSLSGAHINITQYLLSLPVSQILHRIEENYRLELFQYEVKIKA